MASSAWIQYVVVVILIGYCSCKVVLITDHRNGMREKSSQKERFSSKQRLPKVRLSASPRSLAGSTGSRSLTSMRDLGLIGRAQNGEIFGTLLTENNDGASAPQQRIENFIDSFSSLFRPISASQTIESITEDSTSPVDDVNVMNGETTSLRRGLDRMSPSINAIGRASNTPGQRDISVFPSGRSDETPERFLVRLTPRGVMMTEARSDRIRVADSRPTGDLFRQNGGLEDVRFSDVDEGRIFREPVIIGGNDDISVINEGARVASGSQRRRPSAQARESIRSRPVQVFSEQDQQVSTTDDRSSLFNGFDDSVRSQNVLLDDRSGSMSVPTEERRNLASTLRTDDSNAGGMSSSSLGNNLISTLLSRIFSTTSGDSDASLSTIDNVLGAIDNSQSETIGSQQEGRTSLNRGITDEDRAVMSGQAREQVTFNDGREDFAVDNAGLTRMSELFNQRGTHTGFKQEEGRQNSGTRDVEIGQHIDDESFRFGSKSGRVVASKVRPRDRTNNEESQAKSDRTMSSPNIHSSKKGTFSNSRDTDRQQIKSSMDNTKNGDSTNINFVSRGPYMVFQTSKQTRTKSRDSPKLGNPKFTSNVGTKDSRISSVIGTRNRASFRNQITRQPIKSPANPTLARTNGSNNGRDTRQQLGASGSMHSIFSSGFPGNTVTGKTQGTIATSPRSSNSWIGNNQNSLGKTGSSSSPFQGSGKPDVPVRVFMILPTRATAPARGVTVNPSARGSAQFGQASRFIQNRGSPLGTSSISVGSTSNLGGFKLPNQISNIVRDRSTFGRARTSANRVGNIWNSPTSTGVKSRQGIFQGNMMTAGGTY